MDIKKNISIESVLMYAEKGWPVLPLHSINDGKCTCGNPECSSPGKHPRIKDWQNAATTDAETIRSWWEKWPDSNVGLLTGARSGFVVLDVDGPEGLATVEKLNLPVTVMVRTGKTEGRHFYFKAPDFAVATKIRKVEEIDLKANGGYVVAPPSLHHSGRIYSSENIHTQELAPLPGSVSDLLGLQGGQSTIRQIDSLPVPVIPEHHRNSALASFAGKMRRIGLTSAEIFAALKERNRACDPPLEEQELERIANSIARYLIGNNEAPLILKSAQSILDTVYEPIRWVAEPLLAEGLALLVGSPKIGKSLLALNLAISVAAGEPFLGKYPVERGRVMFLALEDSELRIQTRVEALMKAIYEPGLLQPDRPRPILELLDFGTKIQKSLDGGIDKLDEWLTLNRDARLIVVDTLARFRSTQRSQGADAYRSDVEAMEPLQALAVKHRVCLMLIHHDRKMKSEDPIDSVSGSRGLPGTADQCWLFTREDRGKAEANLECFGRDFEEVEIGLTTNGNMLWKFAGKAVDIRISKEAKQVLDVLAEIGHAVKSSFLAHEIGMPPSKMSKLLKKMLKDGRILSPAYGTYSILK